MLVSIYQEFVDGDEEKLGNASNKSHNGEPNGAGINHADKLFSIGLLALCRKEHGILVKLLPYFHHFIAAWNHNFWCFAHFGLTVIDPTNRIWMWRTNKCQ